MSGKLEVSFNSPQCGWMSIGFKDGANEFHTTTAYTPHSDALSDFLKAMISLVDPKTDKDEFVIQWSRNPEAYNFHFERSNEDLIIRIFEYPTSGRAESESEKVFQYEGGAKQVARAFHETFKQLYEERDIDEFEDNWHQKFPLEEFTQLRAALS